jgi:hypothetical protein
MFPFFKRPVQQPHLMVSSQTVHSGSPFTVHWDAVNTLNARQGAWIGAFPSGTPSTSWKDFVSTGNQIQGSTNMTINTERFGNWEIRYFASETSYTAIATVSIVVIPNPFLREETTVNMWLSNSVVTDGQTISVSWNTGLDGFSQHKGRWIGVFPHSDTSNKYRIWQNTGEQGSGSITFTVNANGKFGRWEARYFNSGSSYKPLAKISFQVIPRSIQHVVRQWPVQQVRQWPLESPRSLTQVWLSVANQSVAIRIDCPSSIYSMLEIARRYNSQVDSIMNAEGVVLDEIGPVTSDTVFYAGISRVTQPSVPSFPYAVSW